MAEAFDQTLSAVAAPRGAESFGRARLQRPQAKAGGLAGILDIGTTIFAGALKIREDERSRGLSKEVSAGIADSLGKMRKLKEAGTQGKDASRQFNVRLMALSKELQVRGFDSEDINAAFRDEGFLPPKAALFQEIADEESREEVAQANREEGALDSAFELGVAVTDANGVMDREATLDLIQNQVRAQAAQAQVMAGLGVVRKPDGTFSETARFRYFQKRPELRSLVFRQLLVGLRGPVNKLNLMLRTASPSDVGEIKKQMLDVTDIADQFRLEQVRLSNQLTGPEREDHLAYVDSLLLSVSGAALGIQDAKDLGALKAIANTMDWANRNLDILNIEDFPTLAAISRMSAQMGAAFASVGLGADDTRALLQRKISKELIDFANKKTPIADFVAPPNPQSSDVPELGANEAQHSAEDQIKRVQKSIDLQAKFARDNIVVQKSEDGFAWLAIQGPTFNKRNELTKADKDVLAKQMTDGNYLANLQATEKFFPDKTAAVGAYSFDMVQQDLQTNVRELRNLSALGRKDRDFEIEYNAQTKKFEALDTKEFVESALAVEESLGTPKGGTFASVPSVQKRLERINKDVTYMMQTRQFKDVNVKMTDMQFLDEMKAVVAGKVVQPGAEEGEPTTDFDQAADFIADFEKFVPVAKAPAKGDLPTNGFGNTRGVKVGDKTTRKEARKNLILGIEEAMIFLDEAVAVPMTENQRVALASLVFNVGKGAFGRSKALKALNAGDLETFREEVEDEKKGFVRLFSKGPVLPGLVKRRKAEMKLFFKEGK